MDYSDVTEDPEQSDWAGQNPPSTPETFAGQPLTVPYDLSLPRGCHDGLLITIAGQLNPDAKRFTVDLCRGNDIAMHIKLQLSDGGEQNIIRNSRLADEWGTEEREVTCHPFVRGNAFELKIQCTSSEFKVAVNGEYLFEFKHRIPELDSINKLGIYNDVTLTTVSLDMP